MSRKPLIAANWKMNKSLGEADAFLDTFLPTVDDDTAEVFICPPFTCLGRVAERCSGTPVRSAAQNMHFAPSGAYTGEVAAEMLLELAVDGVVLGHSERRQLFGETDEDLALKVPRALEVGLTPILCVGESEEERRSENTEAVLSHQVLTDLAEVHDHDLGKVVIAYEPIWAIGTGLTASAEQAEEACRFIRTLIGSRDRDAAAQTRILYGGSVNPGNATELLSLSDVDGALVGGASLDPGEFGQIVSAGAGTA